MPCFPDVSCRLSLESLHWNYLSQPLVTAFESAHRRLTKNRPALRPRFELSLLCQMAEEKWQLAAGNISIPLKLQEVAIFQEFFQDFSGFFRSYSSICRWVSEGKSVPGQGARKPQNRLFLIRRMFVDGAGSYSCIYIYILYISLYIESGFDPFISRYKWHICWVMFPIIK